MSEVKPAYNIKAVIRETGLTPATLRAWERRYGILKPKRSPGGHRLYTQEEIDMLKWLVARQSEGLSISRAIELWLAQRETMKQQPAVSPAAGIPTGSETLDALRSKWIAACRAFDEATAELSLTQALAIAPPEIVCTEFIQKAMVEIGEGWYKGIITTQQEHFASSLATRRLNALLAAAPHPTRAHRLLFACPPGETHELALLMLAVILRWQGWDVIYLGADVPLAQLDATLQSTRPKLVLSVAQTLSNAASLKEMGDVVKTLGVPFAFGGGIFHRIPELVERIPGYFLGHELIAVPAALEELLAYKPKAPEPAPLSSQYLQTLEAYSENEALILRAVHHFLRDNALSPRTIEEANRNFSKALLAALKLGYIQSLDYMVGWLEGLMENYGQSPSLARSYFQAFYEAVREHLGSRAQLILEWFEHSNEMAKL